MLCKKITSMFALLGLLAVLGLMLLPGCASAQTTIFTHPDPAIVNFRLTTSTINFNGGTQPWVRIAATLHTGDVVHVAGTLNLTGGYVRLLGCGQASSNTFSGTDTINDTITCSEDASYITIIGQSSLTVGAITALSVDVS